MANFLLGISRLSAITQRHTNALDTTGSAPAPSEPPKTKSSKPSAKKASASKKAAKKPAKKSRGVGAKKAVKKSKPKKVKKAAAKNKGGRVMLFPDRTICRLPKGSLKALGAAAKRNKITQGEVVRVAIAKYLASAAAAG